MPAGLVSLRISGLDIRITVLHDKKKKNVLFYVDFVEVAHSTKL